MSSTAPQAICEQCAEYLYQCRCPKTPPSIEDLEKLILSDANAEYFNSKLEGGTKYRITPLQARCVIRAWMRRSMPFALDD